jgi:hypothetical protein
VADEDDLGCGCVVVDEVEHPVEPLGRRGVGTVVWVLAVDEAADGDAVVLLIGEFSDELCVTSRSFD